MRHATTAFRLTAAVIVAFALGFAPSSARGGDADWTHRDFRLKTITALLADPDDSYVEFRGTLTQQALAEGLSPHIRFDATVTSTCENESDPTQTMTRELTLSSFQSADMILAGDGPDGVTYTKPDSGTVRWSGRWTFNFPTEGEFWRGFWCEEPLTHVVRDVEITRVQGIAWLGIQGTSPPPGTMSYNYVVGAGETVQHFSKADGIPH